MPRIDGMVGIGITMVVNIEVRYGTMAILRLQCFVLLYRTSNMKDIVKAHQLHLTTPWALTLGPKESRMTGR
jgi:hypothetical protein